MQNIIDKTRFAFAHFIEENIQNQNSCQNSLKVFCLPVGGETANHVNFVQPMILIMLMLCLAV